MASSNYWSSVPEIYVVTTLRRHVVDIENRGLCRTDEKYSTQLKSTSFNGRGAILHRKVVVTGVGNIWRARGARAYNGSLGAEPQRGPGSEPLVGNHGGEAPEAERFWQTNVKSVRIFSTERNSV